MKLTFKKLSNRWFIDIPYYGCISDLEMVMGADTLLDSIPSIESDKKIIEVYEEYEKEDYQIMLVKKDDIVFEGAWYEVVPNYLESYSLREIWLCDVVKYLFNIFPKVLYIKY